MLIENRLLLELKAVQALLPEHSIQLVNYLTGTGHESGLLINFGEKVNVKRKFRDYRKSESNLSWIILSILRNPVYPVYCFYV